MFRKLRRKIEQALDALEKRSPSDAREDIDRLLAGMREELIEAKASLPELEKQIRALRALRTRELGLAEDCVRRALQAERIGDVETRDVARQFEEKHRSRVLVYDSKIEAAEAELVLQTRTVSEMTGQLKSALARREALAAQARRSRATDALRGGRASAVDSFDDIARGIEDAGTDAAAAREIDEALGETGPGTGGGPLDPEELAALRLEELKRRMREGDPDS